MDINFLRWMRDVEEMCDCSLDDIIEHRELLEERWMLWKTQNKSEIDESDDESDDERSERESECGSECGSESDDEKDPHVRDFPEFKNVINSIKIMTKEKPYPVDKGGWKYEKSVTLSNNFSFKFMYE